VLAISSALGRVRVPGIERLVSEIIVHCHDLLFLGDSAPFAAFWRTGSFFPAPPSARTIFCSFHHIGYPPSSDFLSPCMFKDNDPGSYPFICTWMKPACRVIFFSYENNALPDILQLCFLGSLCTWGYTQPDWTAFFINGQG
jgi:hypothetical protein